MSYDFLAIFLLVGPPKAPSGGLGRSDQNFFPKTQLFLGQKFFSKTNIFGSQFFSDPLGHKIRKIVEMEHYGPLFGESFFQPLIILVKKTMGHEVQRGAYDLPVSA